MRHSAGRASGEVRVSLGLGAIARRAAVVVAAVMTLALLPAAAAAVDWHSVTPASSAGNTKILVGSKTLTYHRSTSEQSVRFTVEGPTRVKVLTRLRVPTSETTVDYEVAVLEDGVPLRTESMTTGSAGPGATYLALEMFTPGEIRRVYIDVPTGRHTYDLLAGTGTTVDVRVFESADGKPKRVSLAPREYAGVETLLTRDNELTYYLATAEKPVVLELSGPTVIKVNARLLFDEGMLGEHAYMLGLVSHAGPSSDLVQGDGDLWEEETVYRLSSKASTALTCRDRGDVLPGALRSFELTVPDGRHSYAFRLAGGAGREVALKFYIPKGDVENGS